jgi:hypothetical protein
MNMGGFLSPFLDWHVPCSIRISAQYIMFPITSMSGICQRIDILSTYYNSQLLEKTDTSRLSWSQKLFFSLTRKRNSGYYTSSNALGKVEENIVLNKLDRKSWALILGACLLVSLLGTFSMSATGYIDWTDLNRFPVQGDCLNNTVISFLYVELGLLMLVNMFLSAVLKNTHDNLNIRYEINIISIIASAATIAFVILQHADGAYSARKSFGSFNVFWIGNFLIHSTKHFYPLYLVSRLKNLELNEENFVATLNNAEKYFELVDVIKMELSVENALFIEECYKLCSHYNREIKYGEFTIKMDHLVKDRDYKKDEHVLKSINRIYKKFIRPGCDYEIALSQDLVNDITEKISKENVEIEVLFPAIKDILDAIFHNSFPSLVKRTNLHEKVEV